MATPVTTTVRDTPRHVLAVLWARAGFADRLHAGYFVTAAALILLRHERLDGWGALLAIHLAGLALVAALVAGAAQWPAAHAWYPLVLPIVTFTAVARLNLLLVDAWQDPRLLAVEGWMFAEPPTVWLRRIASPLAAAAFQVGYLSYYLLLLIVAGLLRRRRQEAAFRGVIAASVLAYLACYVVFVLWPTEGPAHTLRHLPTAPVAGGPWLDLVRLVQRAGVHGNAFPSAHAAGALPPIVFAWRFAPRLAACLTPLVVLMGCGAVYDGYHYASDVAGGAVVGASAAAFVLAAQASPGWARRLNLPAAS